MLKMQKNINRKYFVYGAYSNWADLKYMFKELYIDGSSTDYDELLNKASVGFCCILCSKDKLSLKLELCKKYGEESCITDDELIMSLNYPLFEKIGNRPLFVWGTGGVCDLFIDWLGEKSEFSGFIDSNKEKWGCKKHGKVIMSPEAIKGNCFIVVATNNFNFVEIEKRLLDMGKTLEDYVSANVVMDDVAAFFKRVYEHSAFYPVSCMNTDENVRISQNGNVCSCCLAYESVYGNILTENFEKIWKSNRAKIGRLSLIKKAYVFCDKERCAYLKSIKEEDNSAFRYTIPESWSELPFSIAPEIDASCNIHCNSCRKDVYVDTSREREIYADVILKKVVSISAKLIINTVGEPFASKNCMNIIYNSLTKQKRAISIYTNGLLLTADRLNELLCEYDTIDISVSVDAATKDTYEKIRLGGDFVRLSENLMYISKMKKKGKIPFLRMSFTVQRLNVSEIQDFVYMAENYGADRIIFNTIENWGVFTDDEFAEVSIMENGVIKSEFRKFFTDYVINNPRVDVFNFSNALGLKPKKLDYMH